MHILLTNDDGIFAPGLAAIYKKLTTLGKVSVVAPSDAMSGASHSITLNAITCDKMDIAGKFQGYSVSGSPADCVKLATMNLIEEPIDLVVSGINCGANVGIYVHYSGTVAAAMEAAFCNIPAVAMSTAYEEGLDIDASAQYCLDTLQKLLPVTPGDVININIPKLSLGIPKGVKVVPHSTRGYDESYVTEQNDKGQTVYYYTGGPHRDKDAVIDTTSLIDGFITVTALHFDMTDIETNRRLEDIEW